jgi:electron transfer flavoprotein alpha subunit
MAGILTVLEQSEGRLRRVSLELLTAAREMGGPVTALVFGAGGEGLAEAAGRHGAESLIALSEEPFQRYSSDGFAEALAAVARSVDPDVILFPATAWGKDLAPRVSGLLKAGLVSDCTGFEGSGASLRAIRPVYAGKAFQRVRVEGRPALFGLRPNVHPVIESGGGPAALQTVDLGGAGAAPKAQVTGVTKGSDQVELTEAQIIVSGGRGMKAPENFKLLDELAAVLGAAVGSSRPVADEGWVPHSYHVGQTGKVVSPDVYFAVGISGAIQHVAGISSSKYIVAINNDPEAPIFKVANYGIVGDLFQVVPALTDAVRTLKEQQ